jgi:hypothetical protein
MHSTNYQNTLILPSPDCPATGAALPRKPGSIAAMQHERMAAAPYGLTSDELLFGIHADRQGIPADERAQERDRYFSKGQACLRASPLVKTLGWALHHDGKGRVALVDPAGAAFADLAGDPSVTKLSGMRSKRA